MENIEIVLMSDEKNPHFTTELRHIIGFSTFRHEKEVIHIKLSCAQVVSNACSRSR